MYHLLSSYLPYQRKQHPARAKRINQTLVRIKKHSTRVISQNTTSLIELAEAHATKAYWSGIKIVAKQTDDWTRVYPRASDSLNKALNIGYTLLASKVSSALNAHNLDASIGILHF